MKPKRAFHDPRTALGGTTSVSKQKTAARKLAASEGFNLIEVSLALAIVSIGIIAILGLLPNALQSSRNAADNTVAATIAQDVFSEVRTDPFNVVNICPTCGNHDLTGSSPQTDDTICYDKSGYYVDTTSPDRYFQVTVKYDLQSIPRLWQVTEIVQWPALAAAPANSNIFVSLVTQYDNP